MLYGVCMDIMEDDKDGAWFSSVYGGRLGLLFSVRNWKDT